MTETHRDVRRMFEDVAKMQHQLRRRLEKVENAPADLRNAAIDGGRGLLVKADGQETIRLGDHGIEHQGGPVPERPDVPFVDAGGESVKIQHSGLDVYESPAPANFRRAQIHVAQAETFEPGLSTLAGYMDAPDGSFTHRLPGGEWYVGLVWETLSGKQSPMSETTLADVESLVDTGDIEDALAEAEARLDDFEENVAGPRFEQLETGLAENSESLSDARDRLTSAEETLRPLPGQMVETREQATEAREAAEAAEARAVEANNRSMTRLANGNFESGLLYWDVTDVDISGDAHSGTQSALIGSGGSISPASSMPVVEGQIWELSLYHKTNGGGTVNIRMESVTEDGTRTIFEEWSIESAGWADTGALRATIPADVDLMSFTVTGDGTRVDDITLRDVTDVVRLEEAARSARKKAETVEETIEGSGGIRERLGTAEENISKKVDSTRIDEIDDQVETALSGPVTHDRLRAGEGAFDEAFVDELWVRNVRALAAELARAVIAAPNLWPDPEFERNVYGTWERVDGGIERDGSESLSVSYVTDDPELYIPVEADTEYRFTMDVTVEGDGRFEFWTRDADESRTYVGGSARGHYDSDLKSRRLEVVQGLVYPDSTYMYVGFGVRDSSPSTRLRVENLKVQRMTDGSLVVENTIGTRHLNVTGEMTAAIVNADKSKVIELIAEDLIAQNATLINTSMQNLSVTERADFAKAYAQELWAELGVFERLQASEAWIAGTMFKDGAVHARHLTVTEDFIAKIAQFIEVWADKFWANQAFIDRMAASEAYFGSEDADQQTRIDGTGMLISRKDETDENIPRIQLGGGQLELGFYDEQGEPTGRISAEGDVTGRTIQASSYNLGGRPIFGDTEDYPGEGPIMDGFTQKIAAYGHRDMSSLTKNSTHWGFLEVQAQLKAGRSYKVEVPPFRTTSNSSAFLRVRYTLDGSSPNWTSDNLFTNVAAYSNSNKVLSGAGVIHTDEDAQLRAIVFVNVSSGTISFASYAADVSMLVTDLGPTPPGVGLIRDATDTNHDNRPLVREYSTGWPLSWHQHYRNGTAYNSYQGNNLYQGKIDKGENTVATVWGGYQTTTATVGSTTNAELGRTIPQALSGDADLQYGTIRLTGRSTSAAQSTYFRVFWHIAGSAPSVLPLGDRDSDSYIGATTIGNGETKYFDLPQSCLDAFQAGQPVAFSLQAAEGNTLPYAAIQNRDDYAGPIVALHYTR